MALQTHGSGSTPSQSSQSNGKSSAPGNGSIDTNLSGSQSPSLQAAPDTSKRTNNNTWNWRSRLGKWWFRFRRNTTFLARAYGGSLIITSIGFPIFASAVTVGFFLAPHFTLPWLYLEHLNPNWYAPVYGFLTSFLALILFAAFRIHFATARGANMTIYELLKNRHSELKARLGNIDISKYMSNGSRSRLEQQKLYENDMKTIQHLFKLETDDDKSRYGREALRKIFEAYYDLDLCLLHNHSGTEPTRCATRCKQTSRKEKGR